MNRNMAPHQAPENESRPLALNAKVEVAIAGEDRIAWHRATIICRTFEAAPRFDVRLDNVPTGKPGAIIAGLPTAQVRKV